MKIANKKTTGKNNSSARVVDGKLILSFPDALNPVVWQMDLVQAKASALEVREGAKGSHVLVLKAGKNDTTEIAPFASREEAVQALMAVSGALENAHGQIRPGAANDFSSSTAVETGGKVVGSILMVLMIGALFAVWISMARSPATAMNNKTSTASGPTASAGEENGVPLSADEFLMKRKN